ncbi:MAG: DMT family transporter [Caldiserica bacterium]|jgi:drug/metabolite transporter (DMT)-like permease|nr:DMT family transporter [Caldisericota bacterium]MDH7563029.1 DMT family transporter [Caldisericota bacterium]
MSKRLLVITFIALIAVSFGSILARLSQASSLVISFYRVLLAVIFLYLWAKISRAKILVPLKPREIFLLFISGFALGAHFYFWITSLKWTTVSSSTILVSTHVIFVTLGERIFNRRTFPLAFLFALILAIGGVVLIANADFQFSGLALKGDFFALLGGLMAAVYFFSGSVLRARLPILTYGIFVYSVAAFLLGIAILVFLGPLAFVAFPPSDIIWFSLLALGPQILGHTLLNYLLAFVRPAFLTMSVLFEPVGATIWALIIFKEVPGVLALIGGAMVVLGLAIIPRNEAALVKDQTLTIFPR